MSRKIKILGVKIWDISFVQAKKMIGAGVVGLVVILVAYAVARFVLTSIYTETVE